MYYFELPVSLYTLYQVTEEMADIKIKLSENGPLLVNGPVVLEDALGNPVKGASDKMALCRCGCSGNKPFCDGTHRKVGFVGT